MEVNTESNEEYHANMMKSMHESCDRKLKEWESLQEDKRNAWWAGDVLSCAIVGGYFDGRVRALCNWILSTEKPKTEALIDSATMALTGKFEYKP